METVKLAITNGAQVIVVTNVESLPNYDQLCLFNNLNPATLTVDKEFDMLIEITSVRTTIIPYIDMEGSYIEKMLHQHSMEVLNVTL